MPRLSRVALTAAGAAAGAVAVGGLAALVSRRLTDEGGPVSHTSAVSRRLKLARVGGKTGSAYALHRARRRFASAGRKEELDRRFEMKTAEQVAETLGNMKGVLMKLGQMASFVDEGIPDAFREALAQLQADAPPMSGELAASVVEQELGTPPDRLFAEWDPVPIASASIGQVHRALTHEGQAVAVKVQYPGVDKAIAGDLENVSVLYNAASLMFRGLDPKGIVDELSERFTEELDYRTEADHQRLFGRLYAGHPFIHIPAVIDRYSTGRVLTTELADGARFAEVEQWPEDERNRAAETIYRFAFRSIYRFSVFNGDPHPGNYLFHRGGGVTFLDFGLVKRFSPDEQVERSAIVEAAVIHRSPAELRTVLERVGFLKAGAPFSDADVDDYFGYFFLPVQEDRPYHYTKEFAIEALHRTFDPSGPHGDLMRWMNIPPAFVILNRIQWGLNAIMARLGATANWRRIAEELWPFTDGPASTELGRQEATWWEERHAP